MLKLNLSNENIREAFEIEDGAESEIEAARELLYHEIRGLNYKRSYTQSRGSFVIIQSGSPEEIEAFDAALDRAKAKFQADAE